MHPPACPWPLTQPAPAPRTSPACCIRPQLLQVAPTILSTLGLATTLLDGVKIEKTAVLPTP